MKISRKWLAEFVRGELPAAPELAALLTARGLEVEAVQPRARVEGNIIAAKIVDAEKIAGSKLSLCKADFGEGKAAQVVCGAANARAGMLAALARPGAKIGGNKIASREIRGVRSAGMLCSAAELDLAAEGGAIMELSPAEFQPGQSLRESLLMNDDVLEVAVTPNRGDCLSHLGVAREVAAALNLKVRTLGGKHTADIRDSFPVSIDANARAACPYYGCVLMRDVDAAAPSFWRVRALVERCGMRAVGAAVDATNYFALAIGQPLHAFDLEKLSGGIRVRFAKRGEKIKLLVDDIVAECRATDLLIADRRSGAALGGVMGGADSAVSDSTRHILLEAAHFAPSVVRGRTRHFGISSEAAFRFERGVDFKAPPVALARAAEMIRASCGGKSGPVVHAGKTPPARRKISVFISRIRDISGVRDLRAKESASLLNKLGVAAEARAKLRGKVSDEALVVSPPSWRFDLEIAEDVVEEVLRARGYDKLPEEIPAEGRAFPALPPARFSERRAREFWAGRGWREVVTYAFVPRVWEEELREARAPIELENPISSELRAMRSGLWGGLLDRAQFNLRRGAERLRLFEIGMCFFSDGNESGDSGVSGGGKLPRQERRLSGLATGDALPRQWGAAARKTDFYDVKGAAEEFLAGLGAEFSPLEDSPALHPGRAARIVWEGAEVGRLGELHPEVASRWEFREAPLLFELDLSALGRVCAFPEAREFSRLPRARRDLAIVVGAEVPAGRALAVARRFGGGGGLESAELFDLHSGGAIPAGRKGLGLRLTLRGESENLTDDEIAESVGRVAGALREELGAELRDGGENRAAAEGGAA